MSEKLEKLLDPALKERERYRLKVQFKGPCQKDTKIDDHEIVIERPNFRLKIIIQRNFINFVLCLKEGGIRKFGEEWGKSSMAA